MADDFRERLRQAATVARGRLLDFLTIMAKAVEEYQNGIAPCAGCHQMFQRKAMHRIEFMHEYASQWWLLFCADCRARLRAAYEYRGFLWEENRKLRTQLKRAIDNDAPATLTLAEWITTLRDFKGKCAYCLVAPYEHLEHRTPIARGGGTTVDNCVPACKRCNTLKGARHPDEIGESSLSPAAQRRVAAYLLTRRPPTMVVSQEQRHPPIIA